MNYLYNKEYGITFYFMNGSSLVTRSTWDDYKLIPTSRPFVAPPAPKMKYLDIPGMDGKLDFTDALLGRPGFANRSGSWEFLNAGDIKTKDNIKTLRKELDGRLMNVVLNGDPDYFYRGRVQINSIEVGASGDGTKFSIDYNLNPYKYSVDIMSNPTSAIVTATTVSRPVTLLKKTTSLKTTSIQNQTVTLENRGPNIYCSVYCTSENIYIEINFKKYFLNIGNNENVFILPTGTTEITINGTGRVQFYYAEGRL